MSRNGWLFHGVSRLDPGIDAAAQNRPSLVVDDLLAVTGGVDDSTEAGREDAAERIDAFYNILLRRGVFKWLAVRRDLIRLKNELRGRSRLLQELLGGRWVRSREGAEARAWLRGYLAALDGTPPPYGLAGLGQGVRPAISALCHSPRVRVQDDDRRAGAWLRAWIVVRRKCVTERG